MGESAFRVALSHDLRSVDRDTSWGDIGLAALNQPGIHWDFLPPDDGTLAPEDVDGWDAVLFAAPTVNANTVSGDQPPRIFARFGVGLDSVDLSACTAAGAAVTITPDGARRAVATAALTLILAVGHNVIAKDRLVRTSNWQDRMALMGRGLTGRTVGTFGLGNIAFELFDLLAPFSTRNYATDPYRKPADARGVELVELEELLRICDIVVITASLTSDTRHAINAERLALMQPHAVLINVARGPIIDTEALADALATGRLAGAGLDVFDPEPLPPDHRLLSLNNVVLSPHALAWTDEMAIGNGSSAIRAILDIHAGRVPTYLANPEVMNHQRFRRLDQDVAL
jgi:phosphoglycerate dehydrogenase-like enzyme